jgi:hypothetical protein
MEPEEKFNINVLYVLKQIKERLLHSGTGGNVWYSVNYNVIVASDKVPSSEDEASILKRLQEWKAIRIRSKEPSEGSDYIEKFLLKILQPKFDEIYQEYQTRVDGINVNCDKNNNLELLKNRLRQLHKEENVIIGQAIYTEKNLKPYLKKLGVTDANFLNLLRYLIEEGYLKGYSHPEDLDMVALTSKGYKWIITTDVKKIELVSHKPRKNWFSMSNPLIWLIFTVLAAVIVYLLINE